MRICIFGATGRTGRHLVPQALELGHEVTIFVRNPQAVEKKASLRVILGDILDPSAVETAVRQQDAVISALGQTNPLPGTILSRGTSNILAAMKEHQVHRFICQSAIGVGESKGQGGFVHHWFIVPFFLRWVYADKERQEQAIRNSGLDWIIVRPSRLVDTPRGYYRVVLDCKTVLGKIARADVAAFMLAQLINDKYLRKAPVIGK